MSGDARCRDGESSAWRVLKLSDHIPQGSEVQTASGAGNAVALAVGKRISSDHANSRQQYNHADKLILYENSFLKIGKLTAKTVGGKKVWDTRLLLSEGSVLCDAGMVWPTDAGLFVPAVPGQKVDSIKPEPDRPYYEIRNSNTVVHAQHAVFYFAPSKGISVMMGSVAIEFTDTSLTKDLFASQRYDPATGEVSQIERESHPDTRPIPIWSWLRPQMNGPAYEVPQRPF